MTNESLRIVGADEGTRRDVRRRMPAWAEGTVALVRSREDWARLDRLEGPAVLLVYDRGYADAEAGGWPTFHIDDLASAVEALTSSFAWRHWTPDFFEEEAW
ncbi:hypothetical protein [Paenibacillus sp.]|uniref:hypothetical protein n=1 Tax=Paenibacillus sp. TaxID=58172 RepID=UPI002810A086|nr:hypothetical protein [Paenibacillus sp.]